MNKEKLRNRYLHRESLTKKKYEDKNLEKTERFKTEFNRLLEKYDAELVVSASFNYVKSKPHAVVNVKLDNLHIEIARTK